MFDGRWRAGVDRGTQPLGTALHRTGLSADQLTATGLLIAVGAAFAIGSGHTLWGFALLLAAAVPDLLDGPLAKAAGNASRRGAFFDSVADRVTDMLLLGGVAYHLATVHGAHAALLPFGVLAASLLVSYERAKAESLGFDAKGGVMERAERVVVLAFGLLFSFLLVPVLWVMLALTLVTAAQRFMKVWRQASAHPTRTEADTPRWTMAAMEARWRARREAAWVSGRRETGRWRARRAGSRTGQRSRTRP